MTNILPLEAQKKVWSMYRARFFVAASLVSLALSALAAVALIPSFLALELAAPPQTDSATRTGANTPNDIAVITRTQALAAALGPILSATSSPSSRITVALSARSSGVTITNITYTAQPAMITLSGTASRDSISAFRDALAQNPLFTNVSIPVDSLIGANSNFKMSFGVQI